MDVPNHPLPKLAVIEQWAAPNPLIQTLLKVALPLSAMQFLPALPLDCVRARPPVAHMRRDDSVTNAQHSPTHHPLQLPLLTQLTSFQLAS